MDYQNEFYQAHKYELKMQTLESLKNIEDTLRIPSVKLCLEVYAEIIKGKKSYEVRKNDRDYIAGDCIALNEYDRGEYTGRFVLAHIISVEEYPQCLAPDYIILQLEPLEIRDKINRYDCYVNSERIKEAQNE